MTKKRTRLEQLKLPSPTPWKDMVAAESPEILHMNLRYCPPTVVNDKLWLKLGLVTTGKTYGVETMATPNEPVTNGAVERIPLVVDIMKKNVDEKVKSKC
ncbi:hypothetical protein RHSIM_Rhsim01G0154700 [Rhododendron simsii]|uniref:Uncharacterized protein n=1 Tax=Rhododendron simsii TaxID=118357 RepID=A0A834LVX5_RHOSS|nr:hypothetical protein RHSIM_Rhsim01G0154700 [Rhododendron simsii]